MKRILIISEYFYPQNAIGALRPTKIREYLEKDGYTVDVITGSSAASESETGRGTIWRFSRTAPKTEGTTAKASRSPGSGLILELKHVKRTALALMNARRYYGRVKRFIEERPLCVSDYAAVFTTFGPISSVMLGLMLKRRSPDTRWICDFRDPMVTEECPIILKPLMHFLQEKACRTADSIIAVSYGYLERICGDRYRSKRYMIPNGYDMADHTVSASCVPPTDTLHIAYVGSLYEGRRKITPLFRVLRALIDEGKLDAGRVCIDYAGREGNVFRSQAEAYGVEQLVKDHGLLTRDECLRLQFSSHFLVLSTWNSRREKGVFPGKFLEYMLIGRPIISLTDGNIPDSEVTRVIREGQLGVAYEAANDKEDIVRLKTYLESCCSEWKTTGHIPYAPRQDVLDRYNYEHIIHRIEELIGE